MTTSLPNDCAATYKILVLGDSNVGKTCIVHRFCDDTYYDTYISTIGVDFKQKLIQLEDNVHVKLQIWDTAGEERFRTLTTAYYRGAMGILLVYDVTNLESFNHIPYWMKTIQENASPDVVKVLVGNKCDDQIQRRVEKQNGQKMAENYNTPFFEVSCKNDVNIDAALHTLTKMVQERSQKIALKKSDEEEGNIKLGSVKFKEILQGNIKCCSTM